MCVSPGGGTRKVPVYGASCALAGGETDRQISRIEALRGRGFDPRVASKDASRKGTLGGPGQDLRKLFMRVGRTHLKTRWRTSLSFSSVVAMGAGARGWRLGAEGMNAAPEWGGVGENDVSD